MINLGFNLLAEADKVMGEIARKSMAANDTKFDRYDVTVNSLWGMPREKLPKPTGPEALAGCRMLLREGFRFYGMTKEAKTKRAFKLTSGNRRTNPVEGARWFKGKLRPQVWAVNPDECGHGWAEIVHSVGHWCHGCKYPKLGGHDISHAAIERHLIKFVLNRGWLDGKLKRERTPKPKPDVKAVRYQRVLDQTKTWEAKLKRAQTALKKLRRKKAYYER